MDEGYGRESDASNERDAPLCFPRFINFGSSRPLPKTDWRKIKLCTSDKRATWPTGTQGQSCQKKLGGRISDIMPKKIRGAYFRQFWAKELRGSETISAKTKYTSVVARVPLSLTEHRPLARVAQCITTLVLISFFSWCRATRIYFRGGGYCEPKGHAVSPK